MIKPKFSIAIFAIVIATISVFAYSNSTKQSEQNNEETKQNIKIANLPVITGLPLYMAVEKGYFTEANIDVEVIKFDSPNLIIDALLSNQVDFGSPSTAMGITAISQLKKPNSLKIYSLSGTTHDIASDVLIVHKNSNLNTISDLKNKKLGILPGIQFRTIAKHILQKNGLTDSDVEIVDIAPPLQVQALAQGQVDAVLTLEPMRTIGINKGLVKDLIKSPMTNYVSSPWFGGGGVVTTKFMNEHPETTKKVIEILTRTINEIQNDPNSARIYLKNYTPLTDELIDIVPLADFKTYDNLEQTDIDALQKFFYMFYTHNVIEQKVNASDLIYKK